MRNILRSTTARDLMQEKENDMLRHCGDMGRRLGAGLLTVIAMGTAVSMAPAGEPEKIRSLHGITEYRLDNGLRVLLFPDPSKPTVTVNITYFVGSRHEGYGETGMAHLLEHMVFKGTPDHPQIWKSLQDHGAQFNGTTWFDRTNYFETMAATEENLDFALRLEADRMVNSHIAKKDLDSEFSVVRNEFEMGENNPIGVLSERVRSTAFLWHNYGKSTIGSREDIERVPIERLQAFYRKYYQPDNAMLVVAGKFDPDRTLSKINDIFGRIPRPQRVLDQTYTVEPTQDGEREVLLRRNGDIQAIICVYHICAAAHPDSAPLDVLADVLTADRTGRLYRALVEPGLATRVSADAEALHDPGVFEITVEVRQDQPLDKVRATLVEVLDGLGRQTFTTEEVDRAKRSYERNFDLMLNDSGRVAIRLTESAASGDWRLMFLTRDRISKVRPEDVQRVAAYYFKPSNRTIGLFIPTKTPDRVEIPATPNLEELFLDYRPTETIAEGKAFDATYANIENHTQRTTLPVGMKLAMLPKETRGNRVNMVMFFRYGSEADLTGMTDAAGMIGPMLMRGTVHHSRRQIMDKLAELKAQVRIGGGGGGRMGGRFGGGAGGALGVIDVSVETTRENLMPVLELVAEILRKPTFPDSEFEELKKESLAGMEQQLSEPMALAMVELQRRINPYPPQDVRYVPTLPERIERTRAVRLEDVRALYKGLVGASASQCAAVGDFDPAELVAAMEKHFGDWNSPKTFQRIPTVYKAIKPEVMIIDTPDKTNAMFTMGIPLEIRDDDPAYPALFMANFILGGNANSRLLNRIRQKEGLSYGCGSALSASPLDRFGAFLAYGICAPQNAEKAATCAREELELFLRQGVTQQELDDARKGYREQVGVTLANDGMLAMMLAGNLFYDRTLKFEEERLLAIDKLAPKEVQSTLMKYVQPDKLMVIRAGDQSKASETTRTDAPADKKGDG